MALYYRLIHFAQGEWLRLGTVQEIPEIGQTFIDNGISYQVTAIGGNENDFFRDVVLNEIH